MLRRLFIGIVIGLLLTGGCGSSPNPKAGAPTAAAPAAPDAGDTDAPGNVAAAPVRSATTRPANVTEPLSTPEALSWKTQSYAQELAAHAARLKKAAEDASNNRSPATAQTVVWGGAQTPPRSVPRSEVVVEPPARKVDEPIVVIAPSAPTTRPSEVAIGSIPEPTPRLVALSASGAADPLDAQLARQIRESPRDVSAHLEYQMLQWLRGQRVPQMNEIAALPADDQEVIAAIMDALSMFRANVRGTDSMLLARKVRPLIDLGDRVRAQTSLHVSGLALCKTVSGFGTYEPLPSNRVAAGGGDVYVYCEVENFSSRLNDRSMWQTDVSQEMVLYSDRGQRVSVDKRQLRADVSRNRRHDLCIGRKLTIPATLAPGSYFLTVTVSDQQANRMAEATIPVQVAAGR